MSNEEFIKELENINEDKSTSEEIQDELID